MSRPVLIACLTVEAAAYLGLCWSHSAASSATYDEPSHLLAGYVKLDEHDFRFVPEHPHLAQVWAALPLMGMNLSPPRASATDRLWYETDTWTISRHWLHRENPPMRLLAPARFMISLLGLLLGAGVVAVAHRLAARADAADDAARRRAAAIAGGVFALCPTMIAHGSLVTTDMAAALGIFGATAACVPFVRRPAPLSGLLAGAAGGVATMLKFSFLLVLPGLVAWWAAWRVWGRTEPAPAPRKSGRRRGVLDAGIGCLSAACVYVAVIWGCYGFRFSTAPGGPDSFRYLTLVEPKPADPWAWVLSDGGTMGRAAQFLREHRLLPEAFIWGTAYARKIAATRASYFLGQLRMDGSPLYFPTVFLLKTPLPVLLLLGVGAVMRLRHWRSFVERPDAWTVGALCAVAAWSVAAIRTDYNIGHRHLTPIYPFIHVGVALTAARLAAGRRGDRAGVAVLAGWYLIGAVRAHPNELAYFNECVPGPQAAAAIVVDSNLDWGQDMLKLAALQRQRHWPALKFSCFTSGDPGAYGVQADYLPSAEAPDGVEAARIEPGVYAVSASCLRLAVVSLNPIEHVTEWSPRLARGYANLTAKMRRFQADPSMPVEPREVQAWNMLCFVRLMTALRERTPDAVAGRSIFVYELDAAALAELMKP